MRQRREIQWHDAAFPDGDPRREALVHLVHGPAVTAEDLLPDVIRMLGEAFLTPSAAATRRARLALNALRASLSQADAGTRAALSLLARAALPAGEQAPTSTRS